MKGLLKHELKNMLSPYYLLYLVILTVFRLVQEAKPFYAAVSSLSFLLIVRLAGDNMKQDEENGWLAMQGILPVTKGQYLLAKYFRYVVICGGHSVVNLSCGSPRRAHLVCIHAGLTTYPLLVSSHLTAWISAIVS